MEMKIGNINGLREGFKDLVQTEIESEQCFIDWLNRASDMLDATQEIITSSYINYQCNLKEEELPYSIVQDKVKPLYQEYKSKIDKKVKENSEYIKNRPYFINQISNSIGLINEDIIPLMTEADQLVSEYFVIKESMKANWEGESVQVQELVGKLYDENRKVRENSHSFISHSYEERAKDFHLLMDQLISVRDQIARKAGFSNYRDYMFCYYGRLDYSYKECDQLAEAIRTEMVPLIDQLNRKKKKLLKVDLLKPWDSRVTGNEQIVNLPYGHSEEMVRMAENLLEKVDYSFSGLVRTMKDNNQLDLALRAGKGPGGFCEFLPQSKSSFIMLNLAGTKDDLPIFLHEMGHAIHHDMMKDLDHYDKELPMETAEFAAMSIELLTLDSWRELYESDDEFQLVKCELFQQILDFLPITVAVDQFQHWMYTHPHHTHQERNTKFKELVDTYDTSFIDWTGHTKWKGNQWMDIVHIFETPFYFIEYAIAQMGALQLYNQFKQNPESTLKKFKNALSLGASKSVKEVYKEAGIKFPFSKEDIREIMTLIREELAMLDYEPSRSVL